MYLVLLTCPAQTYTPTLPHVSHALQAEMVRTPGHPDQMRFCFQCGRLHPLSAFDGLKK
jgi:hypothetical protein